MVRKVIAINSSKRKKNTYNLILNLKESLSKHDISVEIVNLFEYDIKPCLGCEHCLIHGGCVIHDDAQLLMDKLKSCDGIILSTPVYLNNLSGTLKTFVDRTCSWFHRPELQGKPILLLASTAASGLKNTLSYLENISIQWGAFPTNKIGRKVTTLKDPILYKEYSSFLKHLTIPKKDYKPKLNQLITFQVQRVMAQKLFPIDNTYWAEKGWLDKSYFYDCKVILTKKTVSKLFHKMLYSKIKNVNEE
ncbi:flavodoxin family protein [Clostridium sp. CS001]|uniref:flavodoxin family protein n=1 Tax=Clostridium sp. CS001 TaxID=2880648 RepID=UPI001CF1B011|nr:flavodoxin family protein [Clostridium sp. CS001]MCB2291188.1 flavodoxin family protein [Clostridium sp. CS001]